MTFLSKSQILERRQMPFEDVEVPEWGGVVRVQGLSGSESDQFAESLVTRNGDRPQVSRAHYCAKLLALCLVDEAGKRLLTESDIQELGQQSAIPVQRLTLIAERLSGLQVKAVEAAAKN
jgi:hypothetical protein